MICPNCGYNNYHDYGFCVRCAYEFKERDYNRKFLCPSCGNISKNTQKCESCGNKLDKSNFNILITKKDSGKLNNEDLNTILNNISKLNNNDQNNNINNAKVKNKSILNEIFKINNENYKAIILGYLFSVLGGGLGLVFSFYNISRKNLNTKIHGLIQLSFLAFYALIIPILYKRPELGIILFSLTFAYIVAMFKNISLKMNK